MSNPMDDPVIARLLDRAAIGDLSAVQELLTKSRQRLCYMIAARLDRRLASRVDASDLAQETLLDAFRKLDAYLMKRPLPFYAWLYCLARERISKAHRKYLPTSAREVRLDELDAAYLPDESTLPFADPMSGTQIPALRKMIYEEDCLSIRRAIEALRPADREIVLMHYVQQLPLAQIATRLGIHVSAAKMRLLRALEKIRAGVGGHRELQSGFRFARRAP